MYSNIGASTTWAARSIKHFDSLIGQGLHGAWQVSIYRMPTYIMNIFVVVKHHGCFWNSATCYYSLLPGEGGGTRSYIYYFFCYCGKCIFFLKNGRKQGSRRRTGVTIARLVWQIVWTGR